MRLEGQLKPEDARLLGTDNEQPKGFAVIGISLVLLPARTGVAPRELIGRPIADFAVIRLDQQDGKGHWLSVSGNAVACGVY